MRRRSSIAARYQSDFHGVNATPLIDVVMCLIIFFLIVGKLSTDRGYAVRLPASGVGREESNKHVIIVTIARPPEGVTPGPGWAALGVVVQLDGEETNDAPALEAMIRSKILERSDVSVQVRADRELAFGAVEPVLRALGQAGAKSVRLATERAR